MPDGKGRNMKKLMRTAFRFELLILFILSAWMIVAAQATASPSLAGKYEGTAKGPNGDAHLVLELIDDAGKISGQLTSPGGVYKIVKGQTVDGVLTIEAEGAKTKGKLTLRQKDDTLAGDFTADGKTGPVEFKKASTIDLNGEWDAVADAQGQPFPFTLTLKVDGEKVTGSSSSQLGTTPITTGTWKDGKLAIVMEGGAGQIAMMATIVEGKLSGDYDFAGQLSGKWVAIKKK
jgi:hypothetical protein